MDKTLGGREESAAAVIRMFSVNQVLLKIAQTSKENTSATVSF